jgi:hypothetical protein
MFKKVIVIYTEETGQNVQELLIEHVGSEELKTVMVLRQRPATPHEVLLFHAGYGRMIDFDKPNPGRIER